MSGMFWKSTFLSLTFFTLLLGISDSFSFHNPSCLSSSCLFLPSLLILLSSSSPIAFHHLSLSSIYSIKFPFLSFIVHVFPLYIFLFLIFPSILYLHPPSPFVTYCSPSVLCLLGTSLLKWAARNMSVIYPWPYQTPAFLTILCYFLFLIFSSLFFPIHFLLYILLSSVSVCYVFGSSFVVIHQSLFPYFFSPAPSTHHSAFLSFYLPLLLCAPSLRCHRPTLPLHLNCGLGCKG